MSKDKPMGSGARVVDVAEDQLARDLEAHDREIRNAVGQEFVPHSRESDDPEPEPTAKEDIAALMAAIKEQNDRSQRREQALQDQVDELRRDLAMAQELAAKRTREGYQPEEIAADVMASDARRARARFYDTLKGKNVVIQLHSNEDPGANWPVPVCLNGKRILLPRGQAVEVPGWVIEILDDARVNTVVKEVDPRTGNPVNRVVSYSMYPYTILSGIDDAGLMVAARNAMPMTRAFRELPGHLS